MKKFRYIKLIAVFLIAASVMGAAVGCSRPQPPDLSEVYDRYVYLIENAADVNTVFFGEGLPVYHRGDDEAEIQNMYYGVADDGREYVKPYAMFQSIDKIKAAAERVYGSEYLKSLYESLFTGYTAEELGVVLPPRYLEDEKGFYQNANVTPLTSGTKVYDYATMRILPESTKTNVRVEVECYEVNAPDDRMTVKVSFVYESGNWYLDSPC